MRLILLRKRYVAILLLTLFLTLSALPGAATAQRRPRYPVVFIHGLAGSELYNGRDLIWVNLAREVGARLPWDRRFARPWLRSLALKPDGKTPASPRFRIRVGGVLRPGPLGVYTGWLDTMDAQGYRTGTTLFLHTYDWRKGVEHASRELDGVVAAALKANPGAGRVVLVGHSMGGLVARDFVVRTGGSQVAGLIAAGTPWHGAPITWKVLQNGDDLALGFDGFSVKVPLHPDIQKLAQNFPSMYELLPSRHYHSLYRGFVWRSGSPLPYEQAIAEEIRPRNPLLAARVGYMDRLMTGSHYGVRQYLLAGYGMKTMVGAEDGPGVWAEKYGDGDEFVPLASADLGANFDARRPLRFLGPVQEVAYVKGNHNWLLGNPQAQRQIREWLAQIDRGGALRRDRAVTRWYR